MPPISFSPFAPLDEAVYARRKTLQQRMRIVAGGGILMLACLGAVSFQAYLEHGLLIGTGLFIMGNVFLFEAVRQADQRFIAPLQALCQHDYSREVERVLGPLLEPAPHGTIAASRPAALAHRVDA